MSSYPRQELSNIVYTDIDRPVSFLPLSVSLALLHLATLPLLHSVPEVNGSMETDEVGRYATVLGTRTGFCAVKGQEENRGKDLITGSFISFSGNRTLGTVLFKLKPLHLFLQLSSLAFLFCRFNEKKERMIIFLMDFLTILLKINCLLLFSVIK